MRDRIEEMRHLLNESPDTVKLVGRAEVSLQKSLDYLWEALGDLREAKKHDLADLGIETAEAVEGAEEALAALYKTTEKQVRRVQELVGSAKSTISGRTMIKTMAPARSR